MQILPGVRSKSWWEEFWTDPVCDYGEPGETLLQFAADICSDLQSQSVQPKAIDIGAGNGRYAVPLAKIGYQTDALELTSSGISRINVAADAGLVHVNAMQEDFTKVWSVEKEYDVVLSAGLLEEVDPKHHENILQGYKNWTKKGGYVLLKYCLEIQGRGQLVAEGLVSSFFVEPGWSILHSNVEKEMKMSRARHVKPGMIDSAIRTGTLVAQKLG